MGGFSFAVLGIVAFLLFCVVASFFAPTRTRKYRKTLVDLYVAAKIRTLAAKDNLDLIKEYEIYKRWIKKRRLEEKDLDIAIEEELKENVASEDKEIKKEIGK